MPVIQYSRIINLSRPVSPDMPHWPGDPQTKFTPAAEIDEQGWFLRTLTMGEHSSTHVNAPASFFPAGATIDALNTDLMVLPAVTADISGKAAIDPDARFEPSDITVWESVHGRIPPGCLVLLHTGWGRKWNSPREFLGLDAGGSMHFPGFSAEAARILVRERGVAGLGIDTHGLDPGTDTEFRTGREILGQNGLALECLADLDRLPPTGTTVFTGPLKLKGGSGSPACVLALVP